MGAVLRDGFFMVPRPDRHQSEAETPERSSAFRIQIPGSLGRARAEPFACLPVSLKYAAGPHPAVSRLRERAGWGPRATRRGAIREADAQFAIRGRQRGVPVADCP